MTGPYFAKVDEATLCGLAARCTDCLALWAWLDMETFARPGWSRTCTAARKALGWTRRRTKHHADHLADLGLITLDEPGGTASPIMRQIHAPARGMGMAAFPDIARDDTTPGRDDTNGGDRGNVAPQRREHSRRDGASGEGERRAATARRPGSSSGSGRVCGRTPSAGQDVQVTEARPPTSRATTADGDDLDPADLAAYLWQTTGGRLVANTDDTAGLDRLSA